MWPTVHIYVFVCTCVYTCFSCCKLRIKPKAKPNLCNLLHWVDSYFSSLFKTNRSPGWERTGSHTAGWLPLNPPTCQFCSPAVHWAPQAEAGRPWPSWLARPTCPQTTMQSGSWQSAPVAHQALQAIGMFAFPGTKSANGESQSSTLVSEKD